MKDYNNRKERNRFYTVTAVPVCTIYIFVCIRVVPGKCHRPLSSFVSFCQSWLKIFKIFIKRMKLKVSKYFSAAASQEDDDVVKAAKTIESPSVTPVGSSLNSLKFITSKSFIECFNRCEIDFQSFLEAAKVKADYERHEKGLERILRHTEGLIFEKKEFFEREKEERRRERRKSTRVVCAKEEEEEEEADVLGFREGVVSSDEASARKRLGRLLKDTLEELHRLHVNASCRCSTRAPRVKEARDKLTSYRRRAREAYKTVDFERYETDLRERFEKKRKREETDAFAKFRRDPPKSIEEIRSCCELFVRNGRSPHHLCPHLCYYREYEPARQLFVLRIACCEKFGSAKKLEGWTSELALNNNTSISNSAANSRERRGRISSFSPSPRKEYNNASSSQLSSYAVNNSNSVLGSGYKSFPWKVEFKSPSGEIFATAEDVLKAISGEDGDTNTTTTHQAALAVGKSQPPVTNPQGISFPRSSHGGSGKRLPGVKEHGLEQDVEILRAALWKASDDQVHASSPVKLRRLEAETEGYERSPMQLAPPGKGFVESCGDVVTLKVIDYDNFDGDDSDDEEGRMLFSESEYDTDGEDLERRGGRRRRRGLNTREDAHHNNHNQDAFDGYFYEDEEEDDVVVVADEIVNIKKEEEEDEEKEEVKVTKVKAAEEEVKIAKYDDESENKNPYSFDEVKSIKKERKVKATFYAANGDGSAFEKEEDFHQSEEKKLRMAQLNETKMKHSYHSSKLLKLESEPPLVSKFDDEDADDAFFLRKEEEEEAVQNPTTRQQSSVIGGSQRHFIVPPRSPFGLLEEILWRDDWKLLTACMMLNCTTRLQVDRVLWELFTLAPTAEDAVKLGETERGIELIEKCLATIGLHRKRARAFVRLSKDVVEARRGKESALLRLGGESKLGDKDQILALDNNTTTGSENDDDDGNGNGERDDNEEEEEEEEATIPPPSSAPPTGGKFVRSVSEFHGVGAYAADAHAMFCDGIIAAPPRDHALRWYYAFALERESEKLSKNVLFLKTTNAEEEEENVERDKLALT